MSIVTAEEILDAREAKQISDRAVTRLRNLDLVEEYAAVINSAIQRVAEDGKRRYVSFSEMGIQLEDYSDTQVRELRNYLVTKQYRVRERRVSSSKSGRYELAIFWE